MLDRHLHGIAERAASAVAPGEYARRHRSDVGKRHMSGAYNNLLHYAIRVVLQAAHRFPSEFSIAWREEGAASRARAMHELLPLEPLTEFREAALTDEQWSQAMTIAALIFREDSSFDLEEQWQWSGDLVESLGGDVISEARILLVDDLDATVLLLRRLFARAGCRHVYSATDSRLAFPIFVGAHPDLVLVDMVMPHVSGPEVITQLRRVAPDLHAQPIIVLSAEQDESSRDEAFAAGATDYLVKPIAFAAVLALSRELLETRRVLQIGEAGRKRPGPPEPGWSTPQRVAL